MSISQEIETKLRKALAPEQLIVSNESHRHRGHAGDDGSGESHFHVRMRSQVFSGQSRLARHRMVHDALGPQLMARIHALGLDLDV